MREILFRGKTEDGEWIFGGHHKAPEGHSYIIEDLCFTEVAGSTVGEFTTLFDKNKNKIFEGDILKMRLEDEADLSGAICHYMYAKWTVEKGFVLWGKCMTIEDAMSLHDDLQWQEMEVMGNIYDNIELLEVKTI